MRDFEAEHKNCEEKIKTQETLSEDCMKKALNSKDKNVMKSRGKGQEVSTPPTWIYHKN